MEQTRRVVMINGKYCGFFPPEPRKNRRKKNVSKIGAVGNIQVTGKSTIEPMGIFFETMVGGKKLPK